MAADSALHDGETDGATPGRDGRGRPWLVQFEGVRTDRWPQLDRVEAELRASRGEGCTFSGRRRRFFTSPPTETNEAAIQTMLERPALHRDRHSPTIEGRWQLRLWWKPFVTLIWAGGALVAFGGFLALLGRCGAGAARAAGGALRMSRGLRLMPLVPVRLVVLALVAWRLVHARRTRRSARN